MTVSDRTTTPTASDSCADVRPDRSTSALLEVEGFRVAVDEREILRGVDLALHPGEVHALMGANGSGKTTFARALSGHPSYHVLAGQARLKGEDLLVMEIDERARAGLFVAFQDPIAIPGVRLADLLRIAVQCRFGAGAAARFDELLQQNAARLKVGQSILRRYLNEGLSGGEKKRAEVLQMAMLQPELAVLDETDTGLDVDALRVVGEGIEAQRLEQPNMGVLVITHYPRLLEYVAPQRVHVMASGRIVRTGGMELVQAIEMHGYGWLMSETGSANEPDAAAGVEEAVEVEPRTSHEPDGPANWLASSR